MLLNSLLNFATVERSISAHIILYLHFCAAKFLRMTESTEKGNYVLKLEAFFNSCILEGWKDSIVTLQTTIKLPEWSENLGIIRRCIDSIVEKILTPPAKVLHLFYYYIFLRKHIQNSIFENHVLFKVYIRLIR